MYWKKKPSQNVDSSILKRQQSLEIKDGSLVSCYEMANTKPAPSTSCTPAMMKTTALNKKTVEDQPVYEFPETVNCYAELS